MSEWMRNPNMILDKPVTSDERIAALARELGQRWRRCANLCQTTGLMDDRAKHRAIAYKECADELDSLTAALQPELCNLCGHSMQDNQHGFDQNDGHVEDGKLIHAIQPSPNYVALKVAEARLEEAKWWNPRRVFPVGAFRRDDGVKRIEDIEAELAKLEAGK